MDCFAKKCVLIILILIVSDVSSVLELERLVYTTNKQFVNASISSFKNDDGITLINGSFVYVYDVLQLKCLVVINLAKSNSSLLFENEIFRANIDMCKISDGVVGTFVIRWFMENFAQAADFKMQCPFPKNTPYKITNYRFSDSFVPIPKNVKAVTTVMYKGKLKNRKGIVHLFTFKAFFKNV